MRKIKNVLATISILYASASWADASGVISNPATIVDLKRPELLISMTDVESNNTFTGTATNTFPFLLVETGNAGTARSYLLPSFYYVSPISHTLSFGFAYAYPVDLSSSTVYPDASVPRYVYTELGFNTLDLSPSLGLRVNDHFSVGVGLDYYYLQTNYNAMVLTGGPDARSINTATGYSAGEHVGVNFKYGIATYLALAYRTDVDFDPRGVSVYETSPGVDQLSNTYHFHVRMPAKTTIMLTQGITPRWFARFTADYTQWSSIQQILLENVAYAGFVINSNKIFSWKNVWDGSLSLYHTVTQKFLVGGTLGYAQHYLPTAKPFPFAGLGLHYQASRLFGLNLSAAHFFMPSYPAMSISTTTILTGTNQPALDVASLDLVWDF